MVVEIRQVVDGDEYEAVCRFRYEVYVAELGRRQRYADPVRRVISEPLDATGNVFAAFRDGRVLGTVRSNYVWRSPLDEYVDLFELDRMAPGVLARSSVTTKLMLAPEARGGAIFFRLAGAAYRRGLSDGVQQDFIDVYEPLVPFFSRLGYRVHLPRVVHPEFGEVTVMRLVLDDWDYLAQTRSPLLHVARATRLAPLSSKPLPVFFPSEASA